MERPLDVFVALRNGVPLDVSHRDLVTRQGRDLGYSVAHVAGSQDPISSTSSIVTTMDGDRVRDVLKCCPATVVHGVNRRGAERGISTECGGLGQGAAIEFALP